LAREFFYNYNEERRPSIKQIFDGIVYEASLDLKESILKET
jgi:hypothetical protein